VATDQPNAELSGGEFGAPDWDATLDAEQEIEAIPHDALVRGMFLLAVANEAKRQLGSSIKTRDHYLPLEFYPLREHATLLVETARAVFPDLSLRVGLRKLGRGAPLAFVSSPVGRAVLGSVEGVNDTVRAAAQGYELSLRPGRANVTEVGPKRLIVALQDVYYFLDCHHVGAFEGALRRAGVRGRVGFRALGPQAAELLLEW
jgi:uncharacterized protein (TIGR02265 family)